MWSISGRGQRLFKNTLYTSGVKSSWGIESFCEMKKNSERTKWHFYMLFVNRSLATALLLISFLQLRGAQALQSNTFPWITEQLKEHIFKNKQKSIPHLCFRKTKFSLSWSTCEEGRKDTSPHNHVICSTKWAQQSWGSQWPGQWCWASMLWQGGTQYSSFQSFHRTREQTESLSHN